MLSPIELEICGHKGDSRTVKLIQDNLEKQLLNANIVPNEKRCTLSMLFDSIPI